MKFTVVTVFPQLIEGFVSAGLVGQAARSHTIEVCTLNPRQFTSDVHQTVDDKVFGGGDGMVMKVEPLKMAVDQLRSTGPCQVVSLTPQGELWNQQLARQYAKEHSHIALVCGRYAGIDQRFASLVDAEISIGDYILNGGEIAACAVIESIARLKPGVLGNQASAINDSFGPERLLECPQFTRPREFAGLPVPAPLLSGNHAAIRLFEAAVSRVRTQVLRPDLLPGALDLTREVQLLEGLSDAELNSLGLLRDQLLELKRRDKK